MEKCSGCSRQFPWVFNADPWLPPPSHTDTKTLSRLVDTHTSRLQTDSFPEASSDPGVLPAKPTGMAWGLLLPWQGWYWADALWGDYGQICHPVEPRFPHNILGCSASGRCAVSGAQKNLVLWVWNKPHPFLINRATLARVRSLPVAPHMCTVSTNFMGQSSRTCHSVCCDSVLRFQNKKWLTALS